MHGVPIMVTFVVSLRVTKSRTEQPESFHKCARSQNSTPWLQILLLITAHVFHESFHPRK